MNLVRVMVCDVEVDANTITTRVRIPYKAGGSLADKLIVIDPGHGGPMKGAVRGNVEEKTLNLEISNALAAALREEGARVVLTRSGDYNVAFDARSNAAINNNADFFISVHCNSNGTANSATGIETYYHMYQQSPMALACSVQQGVCASTGMRDGGARSDRKLYASGLAVLRYLKNSGIPAILLECGYINHSSDRAKLLNADFRKRLCDGVVAGLKAYVEGSPIR